MCPRCSEVHRQFVERHFAEEQERELDRERRLREELARDLESRERARVEEERRLRREQEARLARLKAEVAEYEAALYSGPPQSMARPLAAVEPLNAAQQAADTEVMRAIRALLTSLSTDGRAALLREAGVAPPR